MVAQSQRSSYLITSILSEKSEELSAQSKRKARQLKVYGQWKIFEIDVAQEEENYY